MNISIYNAFFSPETLAYVKTVVSYLEEHGHQFIIVDRLRKHFGEYQDRYRYFIDNKVLKEDIDFLFSIGGAGTLLRSVTVVRDS
jgi:NAD+ kinase